MAEKIPLLHFGDYNLAQLQQNVVSRLNQYADIPYISGNYLVNVSLNVGDNKIEHKLKRAFKGYFIVGQYNASAIYAPLRNPADADSYLTLNASAQVSLDLWVF